MKYQKSFQATLAIIAAVSAAHAEELSDPALISALPDVTATLHGKPIDSVTAVLGAPQSVNTLGSLQFVTYQSINCLSRPNCYVTAPCTLTLTVGKDTSAISSAKIDGTVYGSPDARAVFLPSLAKLCNADFAKRLSALNGAPSSAR